MQKPDHLQSTDARSDRAAKYSWAHLASNGPRGPCRASPAAPGTSWAAAASTGSRARDHRRHAHRDVRVRRVTSDDERPSASRRRRAAKSDAAAAGAYLAAWTPHRASEGDGAAAAAAPTNCAIRISPSNCAAGSDGGRSRTAATRVGQVIAQARRGPRLVADDAPCDPPRPPRPDVIFGEQVRAPRRCGRAVAAGPSRRRRRRNRRRDNLLEQSPRERSAACAARRRGRGVVAERRRYVAVAGAVRLRSHDECRRSVGADDDGIGSTSDERARLGRVSRRWLPPAARHPEYAAAAAAAAATSTTVGPLRMADGARGRPPPSPATSPQLARRALPPGRSAKNSTIGWRSRLRSRSRRPRERGRPRRRRGWPRQRPPPARDPPPPPRRAGCSGGAGGGGTPRRLADGAPRRRGRHPGHDGRSRRLLAARRGGRGVAVGRAAERSRSATKPMEAAAPPRQEGVELPGGSKREQARKRRKTASGDAGCGPDDGAGGGAARMRRRSWRPSAAAARAVEPEGHGATVGGDGPDRRRGDETRRRARRAQGARRGRGARGFGADTAIGDDELLRRAAAAPTARRRSGAGQVAGAARLPHRRPPPSATRAKSLNAIIAQFNAERHAYDPLMRRLAERRPPSTSYAERPPDARAPRRAGRRRAEAITASAAPVTVSSAGAAPRQRSRRGGSAARTKSRTTAGRPKRPSGAPMESLLAASRGAAER